MKASVVVALSLFAVPVRAQHPDTLPSPPSSRYDISVVTIGAGAEVWERWGHNMIRVRDALTGEDETYDWGRFSFQQENFVLRFLMGRMRYWMGNDPAARSLWLYRSRDRTIVEQHLALTPAERDSLVAFLRWNVAEEHKYYRYDYYRDNCSTRLRDALDQVLGGAIRAATDPIPAGTTYRAETRRLSAADLPLYTGLMLALGPPTDRPISRWDLMFLPVKTMEALRDVRRQGPDGSALPLVDREDTVYVSSRFTEPVDAGHRIGLFLGVGLAVGALLLLLGWVKLRTALLVVGGLFALLIGLGGALLLFLMAFTDHAASYGNENALLLSFLTLLLAVVLRPALLGRPRAERLATALALAVAGVAAAALAVKLFPWSIQDDWETLSLFLPIDLGLAVGTILAIGGPMWRPPRQG